MAFEIVKSSCHDGVNPAKKRCNSDIAQYYIQNENQALINNELKDGGIDFNNDGETDANVKYTRDENGVIIGATFLSEEGEELSNIVFKYENEKIKELSIDTDVDESMDYTHILNYDDDEEIINEEITKKTTDEIMYEINIDYENGEKKYEQTIRYKNGEKTKEVVIAPDDYYGTRTVKKTTEYANGEITNTKSVKYNDDSKTTNIETSEYVDGEITNTKSVQYNDDGKKTYTQESIYDDGEQTEYFFETYNKDGKINNSEYIAYDDGERVKCVRETYEDGNISDKVIYDYYDNGKIKEKTCREYDEEGELVEDTIICYDKHENITQETNIEYEDEEKVYEVKKNYKNGTIEDGKEYFYISDDKYIKYDLDIYPKNEDVELANQRGIGDCWLLATVNAILFKNPDIMNDMVEHKDYGAKIKFAFGTYKITDEELKEAKGKRKFANSADDDVIRIELAMEKMLQDYSDGKLDLPDDGSSTACRCKHDEDEEMLIDGGCIEQAFYFMTGKIPQTTSSKDMKGFDFYGEAGVFDGMIKERADMLNSDNCALTARIDGTEKKEEVSYTNSDGEKGTLPTNHAYSIKKIDYKNGTMIISNPHDPEIEIEMTIEEFCRVFDDVVMCGL